MQSNERILDIAKRAGYNPLWPAKAQRETYFDLFLFAELLLRECTLICRDIDLDASADSWQSRQDCAGEIEDHFGIK